MPTKPEMHVVIRQVESGLYRAEVLDSDLWVEAHSESAALSQLTHMLPSEGSSDT